MRSAEEILLDIFNPSPTDCATWRDDLRLAITLNPSLELIENAMHEAHNQAIEEALQQVEKYNTGKELTPIVTAIINSIKQLKK